MILFEKFKESELSYWETRLYLLPYIGVILIIISLVNPVSSKFSFYFRDMRLFIIGILTLIAGLARQKKYNKLILTRTNMIVKERNKLKFNIKIEEIVSFNSITKLKLILKSKKIIEIDYSKFGLSVSEINLLKSQLESMISLSQNE